MLQTYSRKTNLAIDTLTFNTIVLDKYREDIDELPKNGLYIHGLFIEGSAWDVKGMKIREPKLGELNFEMPCIWLNPITILEKRTIGYYECPLYKTSTRKGILETTGHSNNFVMYMHLKTDVDANHWIRRGTALLTQLDN